MARGARRARSGSLAAPSPPPPHDPETHERHRHAAGRALVSELAALVHRHGARKWSLVASFLSGRIGKQCRERWHNHLDPNISRQVRCAGWWWWWF